MSKFYELEDVTGQEYYQLPKDLIKNPKYKDLSANAKIAYAVLKDRHSVSLKNGWVDSLGVYFLLSDNELADILEVAVRSASRYKIDLKSFELIHMERQGLNRRNKIYLLKPESAIYTKKKVEPLKEAERTKLSTLSKNNLSKNNLSNYEEEEENKIKQLTSFFLKNITSAGKEIIDNKFSEWLNILPYEVIKQELENCALHGAKSWQYVEKALLENREMKITTIEELKQKYDLHQDKRKGNKKTNGKVKTVRTEKNPDWFEKHKEETEAAAAAKEAAGDDITEDELKALLEWQQQQKQARK